MYPAYEENRKIFTDVIRKDPVEVVIQTTVHTIIHGTIHIQPNHRLKDELDKNETFLAVTDATIHDPQGQPAYSTHFMALNRAQIVWLLPKNEWVEPGSDT